MSETTTTHEPTLVDADGLRTSLSGDEPPHVLDVRTPAEFETSHIPGAVNLPLEAVRDHRAAVARHADDVVLVCRSGARAAQAGAALTAAGASGVRVLDGGMLAWQRTDAEVVTGRARWDMERQVRLVAGSLVLVSVLVGAVVPGVQWLAALVGAGLVFAAVTNTCAMARVLGMLPYNRGPGHDPDAVVARLATPARRA